MMTSRTPIQYAVAVCLVLASLGQQPITAKPSANQPMGSQDSVSQEYVDLQNVLGNRLPGSSQENIKIIDLLIQLLEEIDLPTLCDVIANDTSLKSANRFNKFNGGGASTRNTEITPEDTTMMTSEKDSQLGNDDIGTDVNVDTFSYTRQMKDFGQSRNVFEENISDAKLNHEENQENNDQNIEILDNENVETMRSPSMRTGPINIRGIPYKGMGRPVRRRVIIPRRFNSRINSDGTRTFPRQMWPFQRVGPENLKTIPLPLSKIKGLAVQTPMKNNAASINGGMGHRYRYRVMNFAHPKTQLYSGSLVLGDEQENNINSEGDTILKNTNSNTKQNTVDNSVGNANENGENRYVSMTKIDKQNLQSKFSKNPKGKIVRRIIYRKRKGEKQGKLGPIRYKIVRRIPRYNAAQNFEDVDISNDIASNKDIFRAKTGGFDANGKRFPRNGGRNYVRVFSNKVESYPWLNQVLTPKNVDVEMKSDAPNFSLTKDQTDYKIREYHVDDNNIVKSSYSPTFTPEVSEYSSSVEPNTVTTLSHNREHKDNKVELMRSSNAESNDINQNENYLKRKDEFRNEEIDNMIEPYRYEREKIVKSKEMNSVASATVPAHQIDQETNNNVRDSTFGENKDDISFTSENKLVEQQTTVTQFESTQTEFTPNANQGMLNTTSVQIFVDTSKIHHNNTTNGAHNVTVSDYNNKALGGIDNIDDVSDETTDKVNKTNNFFEPTSSNINFTMNKNMQNYSNSSQLNTSAPTQSNTTEEDVYYHVLSIKTKITNDSLNAESRVLSIQNSTDTQQHLNLTSSNINAVFNTTQQTVDNNTNSEYTKVDLKLYNKTKPSRNGSNISNSLASLDEYNLDEATTTIIGSRNNDSSPNSFQNHDVEKIPIIHSTTEPIIAVFQQTSESSTNMNPETKEIQSLVNSTLQTVNQDGSVTTTLANNRSITKAMINGDRNESTMFITGTEAMVNGDRNESTMFITGTENYNETLKANPNEYGNYSTQQNEFSSVTETTLTTEGSEGDVPDNADIKISPYMSNINVRHNGDNSTHYSKLFNETATPQEKLNNVTYVSGTDNRMDINTTTRHINLNDNVTKTADRKTNSDNVINILRGSDPPHNTHNNTVDFTRSQNLSASTTERNDIEQTTQVSTSSLVEEESEQIKPDEKEGHLKLDNITNAASSLQHSSGQESNTTNLFHSEVSDDNINIQNTNTIQFTENSTTIDNPKLTTNKSIMESTTLIIDENTNISETNSPDYNTTSVITTTTSEIDLIPNQDTETGSTSFVNTIITTIGSIFTTSDEMSNSSKNKSVEVHLQPTINYEDNIKRIKNTTTSASKNNTVDDKDIFTTISHSINSSKLRDGDELLAQEESLSEILKNRSTFEEPLVNKTEMNEPNATEQSTINSGDDYDQSTTNVYEPESDMTKVTNNISYQNTNEKSDVTTPGASTTSPLYKKYETSEQTTSIPHYEELNPNNNELNNMTINHELDSENNKLNNSKDVKNSTNFETHRQNVSDIDDNDNKQTRHEFSTTTMKTTDREDVNNKFLNWNSLRNIDRTNVKQAGLDQLSKLHGMKYPEKPKTSVYNKLGSNNIDVNTMHRTPSTEKLDTINHQQSQGINYWKAYNIAVNQDKNRNKDSSKLAKSYKWNPMPWTYYNPDLTNNDQSHYNNLPSDPSAGSVASLLGMRQQGISSFTNPKYYSGPMADPYANTMSRKHDNDWGSRFSQGFYGRVYDDSHSFSNRFQEVPNHLMVSNQQIHNGKPYIKRTSYDSHEINHHTSSDNIKSPQVVISKNNPHSDFSEEELRRMMWKDIENLPTIDATNQIEGNEFMHNFDQSHEASQGAHDVTVDDVEDGFEGKEQDVDINNSPSRPAGRHTGIWPAHGMTGPIGVPAPRDYSCPGMFGYHSDPRDCQSFFMCSWGVPYRLHCPPGTRFSPDQSVCDWAVNVPCPQGTHDPVPL